MICQSFGDGGQMQPFGVMAGLVASQVANAISLRFKPLRQWVSHVYYYLLLSQMCTLKRPRRRVEDSILGYHLSAIPGISAPCILMWQSGTWCSIEMVGRTSSRAKEASSLRMKTVLICILHPVICVVNNKRIKRKREHAQRVLLHTCVSFGGRRPFCCLNPAFNNTFSLSLSSRCTAISSFPSSKLMAVAKRESAASCYAAASARSESACSAISSTAAPTFARGSSFPTTS